MKEIFLKINILRSRYTYSSEKKLRIALAILLIAAVTTSSLTALAQESSNAPIERQDGLQAIIDKQDKILDEINKIQADLKDYSNVKNIKNAQQINKPTDGIHESNWFSYIINFLIIISFILILLMFIRTIQNTNSVDYTLRSLNKIDERIDNVLSHYRRSE